MRWLLAALTMMSMLLPSLAHAGEYAPLNCAKASSPAEKTICKSYPLGQAEARMATLFGIATSLVGMGQRGDIKDAQRKWVETREACGERIPCLTETYEARIGALNGVIDGIASRGPY
jgi:uncharacterized protein